MNKATDRQVAAIWKIIHHPSNGHGWAKDMLKRTAMPEDKAKLYEEDAFKFINDELTQSEASNWLGAMIASVNLRKEEAEKLRLEKNK